MKSRKKEATRFRRWVTSEVLPSIRKSGVFDIEPKKDNKDHNNLLFLEYLTNYQTLMEKINMFDERDRLLLKDLATNRIMGSSPSTIKDNNEEWSISRRLSEHFGISSKKAHKKCSSFGKNLVKEYRRIYGENPPTRSQFVNGTVRTVNCYYLNHWNEHFDDNMKNYFSEFFEDNDE